MRYLTLSVGLSIAAQVLATQQAPAPELAERQLCSWIAHCDGDPCETFDDCLGEMICFEGSCRNAAITRKIRPPIFTAQPTLRTSIRPGRPTPTLLDPRQGISRTIRPPIFTLGPTLRTSIRPGLRTSTRPGRPTLTFGPRQETSRPGCPGPGNCYRGPCSTNEDCYGDLICREGMCDGLGLGLGPIRPPTPRAAAADCEWSGHCEGDSCTAHTDCDGDLGCFDGVCSNPTDVPGEDDNLPGDDDEPDTPGGTEGCEDGSCIGNSCESDDDCGEGLLVCRNGRCGL